MTWPEFSEYCPLGASVSAVISGLPRREFCVADAGSGGATAVDLKR